MNINNNFIPKEVGLLNPQVQNPRIRLTMPSKSGFQTCLLDLYNLLISAYKQPRAHIKQPLRGDWMAPQSHPEVRKAPICLTTYSQVLDLQKFLEKEPPQMPRANCSILYHCSTEYWERINMQKNKKTKNTQIKPEAAYYFHGITELRLCRLLYSVFFVSSFFHPSIYHHLTLEVVIISSEY